MAVYAAHLTRTLSGTPSVFQVAAQEALGSTVKPALRKLVEYLATVYPNKCGWLVDWYDELYLVFDFFLQYHYLKHYAASFSESFYGLLRVPTQLSSEFNSGQRLPEWAERGSLVMLVVLPYLRDKAERITQRWREDDEDGRLGKSKTDSARRAAIKVYSIIHFTTESMKLVQLAAYLSGRTESPTPALAALALTLKDAPPHDTEYTWTDLAKSVFTGQIGTAALSFPLVGGLVLRCAEYGAFAVQFLRWWDSRGALTPAALPPPPPPPRSAYSSQHSNRCPLCRQRWRVPTALPVSGYTFCYICISRYLRANQCCPLTRLPATEHSLVRIYVDD